MFLIVYGFVLVSCHIKPFKIIETSDIAHFTAFKQLSMVSFLYYPSLRSVVP